MKKNIVIVYIFCLIGLANKTQAQIIVKIRPNIPHSIKKSAIPFKNAVWIEGEWVYKHGQYQYINGFWAQPKHGFIYIPGFWKRKRAGYVWIPGHWKRM